MGVAFAFAAIVLLRNAWMSDDAYVTLRTLENFWSGNGLRYNAAERVQGYTHPLWLLTLILPYASGANPYVSTLVVSLLLSLVALAWVVLRPRDMTASLLSGTALLVSRSFVDYCTSGLENPLTYLLLAWFWARAAREDEGPRRAAALVGIGALAVLSRMDNVLYVAPALVVEVWPVWQHRRGPRGLHGLARVALACWPLVAWEAFSLGYYGFLLPNTYYAKVTVGIPRGEVATHGLRYVLNFVATDPAGAVILVAALAATPWVEPRRFRALAVGLVLHVLYVVSVGGDFMAGRFFSASVLSAVLLLQRLPLWRNPTLAYPVLGVLAVLGVVHQEGPLHVTSSFHRDGWDSAGIADEKGIYFPRLGVIGEHADYPRRSAGTVQRRVEHVYIPQTLLWSQGPSVHFIDNFALTDPLLARLPAVYDPGWRPGHYFRESPEGYVESALSSTSGITDARLRRYHENLLLITRGPVFSRERWRAILSVTISGAAPYVDVARYRFGPRTIAQASLATRRNDRDAWDANPEGVIVPAGTRVTFPERVHAKSLDVSLDCNDDYILVFLRDGREHGAVTAGPVPGPGLIARRIVVPREASAGFDEVYLRPVRGDGKYAVGHLIPEGS